MASGQTFVQKYRSDLGIKIEWPITLKMWDKINCRGYFRFDSKLFDNLFVCLIFKVCFAKQGEQGPLIIAGVQVGIFSYL